ncbi:MAG: lactate utilization protein C [Desulfobacterales bacterium]
MTQHALIEKFTEKARAVSTEIQVVDTIEAAYDYAVTICRDKAACQILSSGCEFPLSDPAEELCGLKQWERLMAAPDLGEDAISALTPLCREAGIGLIDRGLHAYTGGIDVGLTTADAGVADTGTIVLNCTSEDLRLATMISEVHIAIIRAADIYSDTDALAPLLSERLAASPGYTAFITGPSRTADIERVLTLGVHGPLALHVLILKEDT